MRYHVIRKLIARFERPIGAEIGVCRGETSEYLLSNVPDLTLHGIDPYVMYQKFYDPALPANLRSREGQTHQHDFVDQAGFDERYRQTQERLGRFGERFALIREHSTEAAKGFRDGFLDFAFIDGNHVYEAVKLDIASWWPKIRVGGLLVGHDYRPGVTCYRENVCRAVDEVFGGDVKASSDDWVWWVDKR